MPVKLPEDTPKAHELPPANLPAPEPVCKATEAAIDAGSAVERARKELDAAKAQVKQAKAADQAADTEAVAAGKALPKEKAAPKAIEAEKTAQRKLEAAERAYKERVAALTTAIRENREEWEADLEAQLAADREAVVEALNEYGRLAQTIADGQRVLDNLAEFDPAISTPWRHARFAENPKQEARREQAREKAERDISASRRLRVATGSDVERILVELKYLATGEVPWEPAINDDRPKAAA